VLLLDEPTSALDEGARTAVEETLVELRERLGISIVLVTHDLDQARRLADWVVRIDVGRVAAQGSGRRGDPRVMSSSIHVSVEQTLAALALVALAIVVSRWRGAGLEEDIAVAAIRAFIQLSAIGYVITLIFDQDSLWLVALLIAVMVVFGAFTARSRAKGVPGALVPLLIALSAAGVTTLGSRRRPRHLRPDPALSGAGRRDGDRQRG